MLIVDRNPGVIQDLVEYVEGRYELGGRWHPQELNRDMKILVKCAEERLPAVGRLKAYFSMVIVETRGITEQRLGGDNCIR